MFHIDIRMCTGCGICVDRCLQQAIIVDSNLAVVKQELCVECGTCAEICPVGAIREVVPANEKLSKGGERMLYGYGRGFGFRGVSPSWPYVGRGRGGLPRCWHPGFLGATTYPAPAPYGPTPTREEKLGFLKDQADAMKSQLEDIERRIQGVEKKD